MRKQIRGTFSFLSNIAHQHDIFVSVRLFDIQIFLNGPLQSI
jgi:hypothetical protein